VLRFLALLPGLKWARALAGASGEGGQKPVPLPRLEYAPERIRSPSHQDGGFGVQLRLNHPVDPQGARVGWLNGQDLFLDVDSAYRAAQTTAMNRDGIVVGVQTPVKRLHESGSLKSVDERRGKLKVRRMKMADG
jgi:hypothetical protein